jgi:hypothetical protein
MFKTILIGIVVTVCLIVVVGIYSDTGPDLEVRISPRLLGMGNGLEIKNVDTTPITITDIVINDRPECTEDATHDQSSTSDTMEVLPSRSEDAHKAFINGTRLVKVGERRVACATCGNFINGRFVFSGKRTIDQFRFELKADPPALQVGDKRGFQSVCNIVRVRITTDKGSNEYTFPSR